MDALKVWLEQAPKPQPLKAPLRWHVFLSYRSVNRPWVIQLYDVLRSLGFEVFLDQFVIKPSDTLVLTLGQGLDMSAAGVLVWSSATGDSVWCQEEYARMVALAAKGKGFRYVVAKVTPVDLPAFADDKVWIDFTDNREGPCGSGLLRLLYGVIGQPLPDSVVRFASQVDAESADAAVAVRAARTNGNVARLLTLAGSDGLAWVSTPSLGCQVIDALIGLKRYDDALAVLAGVQRRFPRSVRAKQLQGLALARKGDVTAAQDVLGELVEQGEQDPETLGIYARTWKDRWAATGSRLYLERSRNTYARAFELTPSDYYPGINAASMGALLGESEQAERLAAQVEGIVGVAAVDGDYWRTATVAEVQLIRRNYEAAGSLYGKAVAMKPDDTGSHESSWTQAKRLLDAQNATAEQREPIRNAFQHLH